MRRDKIVIFMFLICCFFPLAMNQIAAADAPIIIEDVENDVMDISGQLSSAKPNIDITEITYTKDGRKATLTVSVKGTIENRGDIDEILEGEDFDIDIVSYTFSLVTSNETYYVTYVNEICNISHGYVAWDSDNYSVAGDTLTVFFNLRDETETYEALDAEAYDWKSLEIYFDYATSEEIPLTIDAGISYEGKVGESIDFTGFAIGGTPPYTWYWEFGDDSTATEQNPTHTYSEADDYLTTLTVTDNSDPQQEESVTVGVEITNGNGGNGGDHQDGDSNIMLFGIVIIIIIIVGIIAVVAIIRR